MELVLAATVKAWLSDEQELAFIDVREHGQYGESHPFFVSSVPFSQLDWQLPTRVPNKNVRMVLIDAGDGIAQRAANVAISLGYQHVHVLEGGAPAWQAAGYTLYSGVNVPSKSFAEIMELERHTPAMTAPDVAQLASDGVKHVIVDGRPLTEFNKFSIPGAICCPNGELALRIGQIVSDDDTTIIVNCAGRTRSIIGAQTLIDAGLPNPIYALENGTQGWVLAGLERAHGAVEQYSTNISQQALSERSDIACQRAAKAGVQFVSAQGLGQWLADASRTTYVLDVRTPEEFATDGSDLAVHAPGGQLVQGTDEWIGVRGARIVLIDNDRIRAPLTGYWLAQLGHEVHVLDGGNTALTEAKLKPSSSMAKPNVAPVQALEPHALDVNNVQLVDVRPSMTFRQKHLSGARWSVRPMVQSLALDASIPVVLIGSEQATALVASDLREQGIKQVSRLSGDVDQWEQAGLTVASSASEPTDADCIDHLFFTAQRHTGNEAHSHQYLDWEINLVNQLDAQERAVFTVVP